MVSWTLSLLQTTIPQQLQGQLASPRPNAIGSSSQYYRAEGCHREDGWNRDSLSGKWHSDSQDHRKDHERREWSSTIQATTSKLPNESFADYLNVPLPSNSNGSATRGQTTLPQVSIHQ